MDGVQTTLQDQERDAGLILAVLQLTQSSASVNFNVFDLETRRELLESYWSEFQRRDYVLLRYKEQLKDQAYFKSGVYGGTLSNYLAAKSWFRQRITELTTVSRTGASRQQTTERNEATSTQASLEKMKLPTFDGNHREWEHFKEKFTALIVKDQKMDPIIKMQHLGNCLMKEPAEKLKTITFSGANFQTAWDSLCHRYDNLRFSVQMEALIGMPAATSEQIAHLCQLINTVDDSINTFTALGRPKEHWDDIFVYLIESKLAESTRRDWVNCMKALKIKDGFATYAQIKEFIEERVQNLDVIEARASSTVGENNFTRCSKGDSSSYSEKRLFKQKENKSVGAHVAAHLDSKATTKTSCSFCKGDHFLGFCQKFAVCSQAQRRAHVMSAKLCFNCLNANHTVELCQSKGRCLVCCSKHHTKLHQDTQSASNASATVGEDTEAADPETFVAHASSAQMIERSQGMSVASCGKVLLATACVLLQSPNGQTMTARALLDSGAEESFLTEHAAQTLSLRRNAANVVVSGVGGAPTAVARSRVSVMLKSRQNSEFNFNLSALVLRKLSAMIPSTEVITQEWPHLVDLQLADPYYRIPARIDCILNFEAYAAALLPGIKRGAQGTPVALNSVFGWVLMGTVISGGQDTNTTAQHISVHHELTRAVARFWETEEVPTEPLLSPAEQECYDHFCKTHSRN